MSDARFDGRLVVLTGDAEAALIGATEAAFTDSGADVARVDQAGLGATARPDICVCFARMHSGSALGDTPPEALEEHVVRALLVPQRSAMMAAQRMGSEGGTIVVVGGPDATHAYPRRAAASIAMGGLLGMVRAMAVELSGMGIRANLVLVGPLGGAPHRAPSEASDDATRLERTLLRSPMGRLARPEEVAAAIRFVAGPDAGFMTGQTIRVDGGWASLNQTPDGMRFP